MLIMLVNNSIIQVQDGEALFYKTISGVEEAVTIPGGFIGTLADLLFTIDVEHNIEFKGLFDYEFVTVILPVDVTAVRWANLYLGTSLGLEGGAITGNKWGIDRFMIEDDVFLGHTALPIRPYEIESSFTLDGRSFKDVPAISTIFYDLTFGDYDKDKIKYGVIPFVENLESDTDLAISSEAFAHFNGFFTSSVFQLNFMAKYLEAGDIHNSSKVRVQMAERPSAENGKPTQYFLTNTNGDYIIDSSGNFLIVER